MFLLCYDVIDSRIQEKRLADIAELNNYFNKLSQDYDLSNEQIQVHDGDQIRILLSDSSRILKLAFDVFTFLTANSLSARLFISSGQLNTKEKKDIRIADGPVFYLNRQLEDKCKADQNYYRDKHNSIRYISETSKSNLLDILFLSFSKLALKKSLNATVIYYYLFKHDTQTSLANRLGVSQVAISGRLKNMNINLLEQMVQQIDILLDDEE